MRYLVLSTLCLQLAVFSVIAQEPVIDFDKQLFEAQQLLDAGKTVDGIRLLEQLLDLELPADETTAQVYAGSWSNGLSTLCFAYAENGRLREIMSKLNSFELTRGCYCHRLRFAEVLGQWEPHYTSDSKTRAKSRILLSDFSSELPAKPSYLEIDALLDFAQSPGCMKVPRDERLSVNFQCLELCLSMLDAEIDDDSAFEYFKSTVDAANEIAKFYISEENDGQIPLLLKQLDIAEAKLLARSKPPIAHEIGEFTNRAKNGVKKYVDSLLNSRIAQGEPVIFDSELLGSVAPKIKGIVIQGRLSERGDKDSAIILLHFWVPWSTRCVAEFELLKGIHERYESKGLEVVGICPVPSGYWDANDQEYVHNPTTPRGRRILSCELIAKHYGLAGTQVIDQHESLQKDFGITRFPTYVLIDSKGVVKRVLGKLEPSLSIIEELISDLQPTSDK